MDYFLLRSLFDKGWSYSKSAHTHKKKTLLWAWWLFMCAYVCIVAPLTPACLTKNPGQTDEQHDTPDVEHASHLWKRAVLVYFSHCVS